MKEKTADELLKELGYEKNVDTPTNFIYQNKKNNKEIRFYKTYKCVEISLMEFEECEGNSISFTMQELQAINKKCQELRLDMKQWKEIKGYERAIYNK